MNFQKIFIFSESLDSQDHFGTNGSKEECSEEMCVNEIFPKPSHNKLSTISLKHTTHCLAAATHYLLRKKIFDSKISQAALAKEFAVAKKKLHLAVSGRKYDPGKKFPRWKPRDKPDPKKKKATKTDEAKTDEVVKIPEDKQPLQEDLGEPQSDENHDDDDDDSLRPIFTLGTKKPQNDRNQRRPRKRKHTNNGHRYARAHF